jgi:hypothetical protein
MDISSKEDAMAQQDNTLDIPPWKRGTEVSYIQEVPPEEPPLFDEASFVQALEDPLRNFALVLRALPPEHLFRMCDALGDSELDRKLIAWAVAYANGQEVFPPTKGGRRV